MALQPGFAPAKINLTLHVTGRRVDGYHDLDSLVVFADVGDTVTAGPAPGLTLTGPFAEGLSAGPDNLVLRAAKLAGVAAPMLRLDKRLPPASGMGGGSSDAAATLRHYGAVPTIPALMTLGADLPVCMSAPEATRMRGLGEWVEPVSGLPGLWLVLVNPRRPLSTPAVFGALARPDNPPMPEALPRLPDSAALAQWLASQRNDLEAPARRLEPAVDQVLGALAGQPGCQLARMTGSGATCFGVFSTRAARDSAVSALSRGDWWVIGTRTLHA